MHSMHHATETLTKFELLLCFVQSSVVLNWKSTLFTRYNIIIQNCNCLDPLPSVSLCIVSLCISKPNTSTVLLSGNQGQALTYLCGEILYKLLIIFAWCKKSNKHSLRCVTDIQQLKPSLQKVFTHTVCIIADRNLIC